MMTNAYGWFIFAVDIHPMDVTLLSAWFFEGVHWRNQQKTRGKHTLEDTRKRLQPSIIILRCKCYRYPSYNTHNLRYGTGMTGFMLESVHTLALHHTVPYNNLRQLWAWLTGSVGEPCRGCTERSRRFSRKQALDVDDRLQDNPEDDVFDSHVVAPLAHVLPFAPTCKIFTVVRDLLFFCRLH